MLRIFSAFLKILNFLKLRFEGSWDTLRDPRWKSALWDVFRNVGKFSKHLEHLEKLLYIPWRKVVRLALRASQSDIECRGVPRRQYNDASETPTNVKITCIWSWKVDRGEIYFPYRGKFSWNPCISGPDLGENHGKKFLHFRKLWKHEAKSLKIDNSHRVLLFGFAWSKLTVYGITKGRLFLSLADSPAAYTRSAT